MITQAPDTRRVYQQIADQVLQLIQAGEFAVNSRLPSERDLAEQFKVSRPSVREALIAAEDVPEPLSGRNFSATNCTAQFTPATPSPLLPMAPMVPATCVPWPF